MLKTRNLITQPTVGDYNTAVNQINKDYRRNIRNMNISLSQLEAAQDLLEDRYERLLSIEKELKRLIFICNELIEGLK